MSFPSCGIMDLVVLPYTAPRGWKPREQGADEWGVVWEKTDIPNMGQMIRHPLQDWERMASYRFPDPDDESRFDSLEIRLSEFPDKYVICIAETVLTLWERYYSLRGFEQGLTDFYLCPEKAHELLDRVLGFHLGIMSSIKARFRGRIDAFLVSDDWGTQTTTLLPVPVWREFFKGRYRRLVRAIHDAGMHAILHSDGRINPLFPDLVDVGFDAFNLHSPTVVGIEEVGRDFAGAVGFLPCIDIQHTMPRGTTEDVRREARRLLEHWGTAHGGIIPSEYDRIPIGAPIENVFAACAAFQEMGIARCGRAHPDR